MPHTLCRGAWTYSRFKPRSVTRQARLLGITWLLTLGTAALCVLASHGPAVIDALHPVG